MAGAVGHAICAHGAFSHADSKHMIYTDRHHYLPRIHAPSRHPARLHGSVGQAGATRRWFQGSCRPHFVALQAPFQHLRAYRDSRPPQGHCAIHASPPN
eukprot:24106-Chlamydomonas_euryale.AAC.4